MSHHHSGKWTERTQAAPSANMDLTVPGQAFHQPHTWLGFAGHIIHMTGVFVPLLAGELVQDAAKYKKTVRIASIVTAAAYEMLYTYKEHQRSQQREAKLAECRSQE